MSKHYYREFKNKSKFENYLDQIRNRKHRVTLAKFRLSDHILKIEEGRHSRPKIPRVERFCPHCPNTVEDELHFLTQCTAYDRSDLFEKFSNSCPNFRLLDDKNQFIYMMSQEDEALTKLLAEKVHAWMMNRLEFKKSQQDMVQYILVFAPTNS